MRVASIRPSGGDDAAHFDDVGDREALDRGRTMSSPKSVSSVTRTVWPIATNEPALASMLVIGLEHVVVAMMSASWAPVRVLVSL